MKVTNTHSSVLVVAGTPVRPGGTAEIDPTKLERWAQGHAAKLWLKQKLILVEEPAEDEDAGGPDNDTGGDAPSERDQLLARAEELGLTPARTISLSKLRRMIATAERKNEE